MAEDRLDPRETSWRHLLPWTELFRGFRVAIGLSKLGLAAAGILVMAGLWYFLAVVFFNFPGTKKPELSDFQAQGENRDVQRWADFIGAREKWNLMLEAAGPADADETIDAADLAESLKDYEDLTAPALEKEAREPDDSRVRAFLDHLKRKQKVTRADVQQLADDLPLPADVGKDAKAQKAARDANKVLAKALVVKRAIRKPAGMLRTWPWFEDRGPNPFLLTTGQAGVPWESGHFWDWLLTRQGPVLVEPLVKFLRPVIYFFSPRAGWLARLYFLLVILVTLATWAFFGAAITRMAAVEVARHEKISPLDALRFVCRRYLSYALAPLFPLALVAVFVVVLILFGVLHMIPVVGDIVDGVGWVVAVGLGLGMACFLVGLVSWPLMMTTISTEDEEGFNAFARAYSYLLQAPWQYLWYAVVAIAYGAVVVFFVGFMGSLAVYLAGWGVSKGNFNSYRTPNFLFVYAPTSFHWRDLLLEGAPAQEPGGAVVQAGEIDPTAYETYVAGLSWNQQLGAALVAIWLGLFFLLILGFGYSFFWTECSIIYLLLRKHVDDAELDEVYFEEDEQDEYPLGPPATSKPAAAPATPGMTMVEPPSLRVSTPPAPPAAAAPPPVATPPPPVHVPPPPPLAEDRVDEVPRPATTALTPPAGHPDAVRPDGNGNAPPAEG